MTIILMSFKLKNNATKEINLSNNIIFQILIFSLWLCVGFNRKLNYNNVHFLNRNTDVTLRQVWLRKSNRKLQLIYAGETLTDCIDEKLTWDDSECLPSSRGVYRYHDDDDDEVSIEVFQLDGKDISRIPRDLSWLLSTSELRHRCDRMRMRVRSQAVTRHRHRYENERVHTPLELARSIPRLCKRRRGPNYTNVH